MEQHAPHRQVSGVAAACVVVVWRGRDTTCACCLTSKAYHDGDVGLEYLDVLRPGTPKAHWHNYLMLHFSTSNKICPFFTTCVAEAVSTPHAT